MLKRYDKDRVKKRKVVFLSAFLIFVTGLIILKMMNQNSANNLKVVSQFRQSTVSEKQKIYNDTENKYSVNDNTKVTKDESKSRRFTLKAVGDVMLGRNVEKNIKGDYNYPFKAVSNFLNDADITFANLETTISENGQPLIGKGVWLRAKPKAIEGIKNSGIDIVNIANNHILDFNDIAMYDTINILNENKIKHIGVGKNIDNARKPSIIRAKDIKIGFLGYTDLYYYGYGVKDEKSLKFLEATKDNAGVSPLKLEYIINDSNKIRKMADVVVVSLHWGTEESFDVPENQRDLAHKIIDKGADIILGHHPHQLQGIEIYKDKPIIYSMGNFIFDQNDKENNETMIVDIDFQGNQIANFQIIPCVIKNKSKVVFANKEESKNILGYMKRLSKELDTDSIIRENKLMFMCP